MYMKSLLPIQASNASYTKRYKTLGQLHKMRLLVILLIISKTIISQNNQNFLDDNWATVSLNKISFDTNSILNIDTIVFHKFIESQFPDSTESYLFILNQNDSIFKIKKTFVSVNDSIGPNSGIIIKSSSLIGQGTYLLDTSKKTITFNYNNSLVDYNYKSIGKKGDNPRFVYSSKGDYRYKLILTRRK